MSVTKKTRYYEGTTSANSVLQDLSKVLCTAVKSKPVLDAAGKEVKAAEVIIENNWDIHYPQPDGRFTATAKDGDYTPEEFVAKIENQLSKVQDTVILKTKTTPKNVTGDGTDDIGLENDLAVNSIEMFMELYKPKYIADPERFHPETERYGVKPYMVTRGIYELYNSTYEEVEISLVNPNLDSFQDVQNQPAIIKSSNTDLSSTPIPDGSFTKTILPNEFDVKDEGKLTEMALEDLQIYPKYASTDGGPIQFYENFSGEKTVTVTPNDKLWTFVQAVAVDNGLDIANHFKYEIGIKANPTLVAQNLYTKGSSTPVIDTYVDDFTVEIRGFRQAIYYHIEKGYKFHIKNHEMVKELSNMRVRTNGEYLPLDIFDPTKNFDPDTGLVTIPGEIKKSDGSDLDYLVDGDTTFYYKKEREKGAISDKKLVLNNHYLYARIFDTLENRQLTPEQQMYFNRGPIVNEIDAETGQVVNVLGHASEWVKLSWYQDFQDIVADEMDMDVTTNDLSQGIVNLPIETPGLTGDTRLRFWANVSNDRAVLALMGNPSIDYSDNRHLVSMFYAGAIESFENSINDTAGNFALFGSSSSIPCKTEKVMKRTEITNEKYVMDTTDSMTGFALPALPVGVLYDPAKVGQFLVRFKNPDDDTFETYSRSNIQVTINAGNTGGTVKFLADKPAGRQIYLTYFAFQDVFEQKPGVTRDAFGTAIDIKYPDTWGSNTATGVTDVTMYHTRSKAFFQKHFFMFTTTEEFMEKEQYGKSSYTGEYYADRIKITHGNDGPRGMLEGMLVIDVSSLIDRDELIVNRDFSKKPDEPEEAYIFFPITAAMSPLATSPNARYGIAIKKSERLPAASTDEEAVQRVVDDLYIGKLSNVIDDLYLPVKGADDVTIAWTVATNDNLAIAEGDDAYKIGKVTRPDNGTGNVKVTLTADITKGSVTVSKEFDVEIVEMGLSDAAKVQEAITALNIGDISDIRASIILPDEGLHTSTITWTSTDDSILSSNGTVNRPANGTADAKVTLTATIKYNDATDTKEFLCTVTAWTDAEEVQIAKDALNETVILGQNLSTTSITENMNLVTTGERKSTIAWASTAEATIATDGTVVRPTYTTGDATVNLTATITVGAESVEKQFVGLKVLKLAETPEESVSASINTLNLMGLQASGANLTVGDKMSLPNRVDPSLTSTIVWTVKNKDTGQASTNVTMGNTVDGQQLVVDSQPSGANEPLLLTATVSCESHSQTAEYTIYVAQA